MLLAGGLASPVTPLLFYLSTAPEPAVMRKIASAPVFLLEISALPYLYLPAVM